MNIKEVKQEEFDKVVAKFQKYGIGLVMAGYVSYDAENASLWHDLVYPNRVTGKQAFNISRIKNKYAQLFKKAKEEESLSGAFDDELGPDVAFSVLTAYGKDVPVTFRELAIFAFAAYKERRKADAFDKQLAKAKLAKENINKDLTVEEKRARDKATLEVFEKEFGADVLKEDEE